MPTTALCHTQTPLSKTSPFLTAQKDTNLGLVRYQVSIQGCLLMTGDLNQIYVTYSFFDCKRQKHNHVTLVFRHDRNKATVIQKFPYSINSKAPILILLEQRCVLQDHSKWQQRQRQKTCSVSLYKFYYENPVLLSIAFICNPEAGGS